MNNEIGKNAATLTIPAMSYQELAQPAPTVGAATAQAAFASKAVKVGAAEVVEEPAIEAAPRVSVAVVGDDLKFAPKVPPRKPSALSVTELKKQGADFESVAGIIKGCAQKDILKRFLPFIYDERDFISYGEIRRFLFVRGNCIFVYGEKSDPLPLYAIEIQNLRAEIEDPKNPDKYSFTVSPQANTNLPSSDYTTVLLKEKNSRKQSYQITFDTSKDKSLVKSFMDVLSTNAKSYGQVITAAVADEKMEMKASGKN